MKPVPYLFFNGNCREALTHYGQIFGTTPEIMEPGSAPDFPVTDAQKDWVLHGTLPVGEGVLLASDSFMEPAPALAGCAISVSYPTATEAKAIFDQLAEGGEVTMPFEATFWSAGFGMITDKFGVSWMVGCDEAPA